jgi:hypothetical protein
MTLNAVVGTPITLSLKALEQTPRCSPPGFGQKRITGQPLIQPIPPWSKLGLDLMLAAVDRLNAFFQILADRVARQLKRLRQSADALTVPKPASPDLPDRRHT